MSQTPTPHPSARTVKVGPSFMPSYADLPEDKFNDLILFLSSLK